MRSMLGSKLVVSHFPKVCVRLLCMGAHARRGLEGAPWPTRERPGPAQPGAAGPARSPARQQSEHAAGLRWPHDVMVACRQTPEPLLRLAADGGASHDVQNENCWSRNPRTSAAGELTIRKKDRRRNGPLEIFYHPRSCATTHSWMRNAYCMLRGVCNRSLSRAA